MKFSIITVCFNAEKDIEKTIKSVLIQDYPEIEYIIIDGNSTDNTNNIIKKYKNNIDIYISERDNGIYDAMNKGITLSTGDYIFFLHAGDLITAPDILTRINEVIEDEQLDIYYGDAIIDRFNDYEIYRHTKKITDYEIYWGRFVQQSVFYRRYLFDNSVIGLFNCNYRIRADQEWHLRFFGEYKGSYCHLPLLVCRYEGVSGLSMREQEAAEAERRQLQRAYRRLFSTRELASIYLKRLAVKVRYRAALLLHS